MRSWTCLPAATLALFACGVLGAAHAQGIKLRTPSDQPFDTLRLDSSLPELRRNAASLTPANAGPLAAYGYVHPLDVQTREVASGVYAPLSENLSTLMETTRASNSGITSEWSVLGQLGARWGSGWGVQAGLRHSELGLSTPLQPALLPAATADLGMLTFERQWDRYRGAYTYYTGRTDTGATTSGHRIQLDYYYSAQSSVGLAFTTGRQLEGSAFGSLTLFPEVANVGVAGEHWFSPNWALNYNALVEESGGQGLNPALRVGLRVRF